MKSLFVFHLWNFNYLVMYKVDENSEYFTKQKRKALPRIGRISVSTLKKTVEKT